MKPARKAHSIDASRVEFLADVTWQAGEKRISEQRIFDRLLDLIRGAERFVFLDFFLFNGLLGHESAAYRPISRELADALIERKRARPDLQILLVTDPINEAYGGAPLPLFNALRAAGVQIVTTDLSRLRDSNPIYSFFWRLGLRWIGSPGSGSLPHPLSPSAPRVGIRAWLALLNFRANHRKAAIADSPSADGGREMTVFVSSANPHDASSAHGNIALLIRGSDLWREVWASEAEVIRNSAPDSEYSAYTVPDVGDTEPSGTPAAGPLAVRLVSEGRIRDALLDALRTCGRGDAVDIAMFYLSHRSVIEALVGAASRGAAIRLLLDPNRDAFGYVKDGVPNRPAAAELLRRGSSHLAIRWYDTHGEQFHAKMILIRRTSGEAVLLAGSANLTRRNLDDYNLETDLFVTGSADAPAFRDASDYFERLWTNREQGFSVPYENYADDSLFRRWKYRVQEATGLGTF